MRHVANLVEHFIIDLNYVDGCLNDTLNNISITTWPSIFIGGESCSIMRKLLTFCKSQKTLSYKVVSSMPRQKH